MTYLESYVGALKIEESGSRIKSSITFRRGPSTHMKNVFGQ